MRRVWPAGLLAVVMCVGCGGGRETPATDAAAPATAATPAAAPAAASVGSVAFAVDGVRKEFDTLLAADNKYTPLGSSVRARPTAGTGHLQITFLSLDLRKQDYPVDLPLPKGGMKIVDPMAAMASIGFSYIDETGQEWAGPGRVHVESFGADGVIEGTFTDVSLPHVDKARPNIVLTGGTFRARLSAPF